MPTVLHTATPPPQCSARTPEAPPQAPTHGLAAQLLRIGNGVLQAVLTTGAALDTALNVPRRVLLVRPTRVASSALCLGLAALADAADAAPTPPTGTARAGHDARQLGNQLTACILARQSPGSAPRLAAANCLGDLAYSHATDSAFNPGRLPGLGGTAPAAGTPAATYLALVQRGMRQDLALPVQLTTDEVIDRAGNQVLDAPPLQARIHSDAQRVIDACDLRDQVDRYLFIRSDGEHTVDTAPCATSSITGPTVRELSRGVDALYYQSPLVTDRAQYTLAQHKVWAQADEARKVGNAYHLRVSDAVIEKIGL